jgi:RNA polymerase sigma-70 factor (ECF subfamily)
MPSETSGDDEDIRLDLERAIDSLPERDRAVLFMHFYLDLPVAEVARVEGSSEPATRSRIYRACRRLRLTLREEDLR